MPEKFETNKREYRIHITFFKDGGPHYQEEKVIAYTAEDAITQVNLNLHKYFKDAYISGIEPW